MRSSEVPVAQENKTAAKKIFMGSSGATVQKDERLRDLEKPSAVRMASSRTGFNANCYKPDFFLSINQNRKTHTVLVWEV